MTPEFYKMDFRAWNVGTVDLTLEQEAAYLRLCHAMYDAKGPIPNSIRLLMGIFRCGNTKAAALVRQLQATGKIEITEDGLLSNRRVTEELLGRDRLSSERSLSGKRGGTASGVSRSKLLKKNDNGEANASTDRTREEEKRGEENREEEKEKESEIPDFLDEFRQVRAAIEASEVQARSTVDSDAIVFSRGVIKLTEAQQNELKAAFPHIKFDRELGSVAGFVETRFNTNKRAGKDEPWWDILWAALAKKDREAEERGRMLKAKAEAEAKAAVTAGQAPKKVRTM